MQNTKQMGKKCKSTNNFNKFVNLKRETMVLNNIIMYIIYYYIPNSNHVGTKLSNKCQL